MHADMCPRELLKPWVGPFAKKNQLHDDSINGVYVSSSSHTTLFIWITTTISIFYRSIFIGIQKSFYLMVLSLANVMMIFKLISTSSYVWRSILAKQSQMMIHMNMCWTSFDQLTNSEPHNVDMQITKNINIFASFVNERFTFFYRKFAVRIWKFFFGSADNTIWFCVKLVIGIYS